MDVDRSVSGGGRNERRAIGQASNTERGSQCRTLAREWVEGTGVRDAPPPPAASIKLFVVTILSKAALVKWTFM